jgi:hypothetical protein
MSQTPANEKRRNYRFYAGDPYEEFCFDQIKEFSLEHLEPFILLKNVCMLMEISKE